MAAKQNDDKPKDDLTVTEPVASSTPDPDVAPLVQAQADDNSGETLLYVVSPYVRSFHTVRPSGDTLVVTQTGVYVPDADVDSLIADAANSGVTLERSK